MSEELSERVIWIIDTECLAQLKCKQITALENIGKAKANMVVGMISKETYEDIKKMHFSTFDKCQEEIDNIKNREKEVTGFELRGKNNE